ncbi:MAG: Phenylacetic acid catabolic protein [Alphaproteobacteria bacterium]
MLATATRTKPITIRRDVPVEVRISAEEIHNGRDVTAAELPYTPREYIELIVALLENHAIGEGFILKDEVYARWATDAPTTEDRFMVLRTIEEELMHAREGWRMLREIDEMFESIDIVPYDFRARGSNLEGFTHPVTEWAEHAALCTLTDRVGVFQQEEQLDCSYIPYAESIKTAFFPVEKGHAARGRLWLRRLCETPEGKAKAQAAVNIWWPRALDMFGRSKTSRQHRYIYYRLKKRTNEERRQAYISTLPGELAELGLTVPDHTIGRKFL